MWKFTLFLTTITGFAYPASTRLTLQPKDQTWNISQKSRYLVCAATPPPPTGVKWQKNGQSFLLDPKINGRVWSSDRTERGRTISTLTFRSLTKEDEGFYQCTDMDNFSRRAYLTIYGPPAVNLGQDVPSDIYVGWDEKFSVSCVGKGPPGITGVNWNYEAFADPRGPPTVRGSFSRPVSRPNMTTLPNKINARPMKVKLYRVFCIVTNSQGRERSSVTQIHILQAPDPPEILRVFPFERYVNVTYKVVHSRIKLADKCIARLWYPNASIRSFDLVVSYGVQNVVSIGNLKPSTSYKLQARCSNKIGFSEWTQFRDFTTKGARPDMPPGNTTASPVNATALLVAWSPIPDNFANGKIVGYRVKLLDAEEQNERETLEVYDANTHSLVIGKLEPGKNYLVSTSGFNRVGDSAWGQRLSVTMPELPSLPLPIVEMVSVKPDAVVIRFYTTEYPVGQTKCTIQYGNQHSKFEGSVTVTRSPTEYSSSGMPSNVEYKVAVRCKNGERESDWSKPLFFKTPEGKPDKAPESLVLHESKDHFLIAVWERYKVEDLNGNFNAYNVCVTAGVGASWTKCVVAKSETATIKNVTPGTIYSVTVSTCTNAGCGPFLLPGKILRTSFWVQTKPAITTPIMTVSRSTVMDESSTNRIPIVYLIVAIVIMILIVIVVVLIYRQKRRKRQRDVDIPVQYDAAGPGTVSRSGDADTMNAYSVPLLANSPMLSSETMAKLSGAELPRERIKISGVLGEGEFGCVYKGWILPRSSNASQKKIEVAIKTMKMKEFDVSEREEFVKEGLLMKSLNHVNVMRLVGVCLPESGTDTHRDQVRMSGYETVSPLVVIPYMEHGDLRSYLYTVRTKNEEKPTMKMLLSFIHDIASGMEYLAGKSIIHRDLACRNCMLDSNMRVVVSDFGLSRQIYSSNYYRQHKVSRMPVKWMALESLGDRVYTTRTDVWSFGVTCWEVFTFCQNPYPGVANHEMYDLLKSGTRLIQPPGCPAPVWNDAIFPCWDPRPEERPYFKELVEMVGDFRDTYADAALPTPGYVNVRPMDECSTSQAYSSATHVNGVTNGVDTKDADVKKQNGVEHGKTDQRRPLLHSVEENDDCVVNL